MPPIKKLPRTIRMLGQHGAKAMEASIVKGFYNPPAVRNRAAAQLRKRAIIDGSYGSFDPLKGGWNPEWDKHKKMFFLRPFKGHKRDRDRGLRAEKINKALETAVPQKIEKYRQEVQDRRPVKDIAYLFKRAVLLEKGRRDRRKDITPGRARVLIKKRADRDKYLHMESDPQMASVLKFHPKQQNDEDFL